MAVFTVLEPKLGSAGAANGGGLTPGDSLLIDDITVTVCFAGSIFAEIVVHPNVAPAEELAKAALPELQASWIAAIEKGWLENVGQ